MTEAEWLACTDPWRMLEFIRDDASVRARWSCMCCRVECQQRTGLCPIYRKLRLLALACCSRCLPLLPDPICTRALAEVENFIEGPGEQSAYSGAINRFARTRRVRLLKPMSPDDGAWNAIYGAVHRRWTIPHEWYADKRWWILQTLLADAAQSLGAGESDKQANLVRDIFGNPFRPVAFAPAWRTDTAVSLARGMYESRDFSAMPILADALQDAGCDNDDVLNHCRDTIVTHVRGCWVVDLVLDKS